jgi:type IV pilus modification protein PilV
VSNRNGFTIIEVLVAVLVLAIGIIGLMTTAALVTRMIGQGERYSQASTMAAEQFEVFRSQRCASLAAGTATRGAFTLNWTVQNAAGGRARSVQVVVVSPTTRGTRADTFATTIGC